MKTANIDGRLCIVTKGGYVDVAAASGGHFGPNPQAVYARWREFCVWASDASLPRGFQAASTSIGPPAPEPAQIFAIGFNYREHANEVSAPVPEEPAIFTKFRSSLAGPFGVLDLPDGNVDWEVELVVVIGARAHHVPREEAWSYVAGLTVGQDYSERKRQLMGQAPQYSLAKSFPGFAPMGPLLATPDEFDDPDDLVIECLLNGEVVQSARSSAMLLPVPELIARISAICVLTPGDVIMTGTPAGVGAARQPPRFLQDGDEVVSRIDGIGEIVQKCRTRSHSARILPFRPFEAAITQGSESEE